MDGFLVPDHYVSDVPGQSGMNLASVIWGLSLGIAIFNSGKALQQTAPSLRQKRMLTAYNTLCWAEIVTSVILGTVCWLYQRTDIPPSFQFFFCVSIFWSIQVQCLIQIIANRVGLLMVPRSKATRLKWACFGILLAVNISVICIWVPARLQINQQFIDANEIWDRVEKVIFAIMDAALNGYFVFVVKRHLVANGLQKYNLLYRVNLVLMAISICLDITLIGIMSLPNDLVYLQFHPVVYLLKLHIEMKMADLISKVVSASRTNNLSQYSSQSHTEVDNSQMQRGRVATTLPRTHAKDVQDDEIELTRSEDIGEAKQCAVRSGSKDTEEDYGIPGHI